MKTSIHILFLLLLCSRAYAVIDQGEKKTVSDDHASAQVAGPADLREGIALVSESDADCFSAAGQDDFSEKSKHKKKNIIPSLSSMDKQGYKFFIAAVQNISSGADLEMVRVQIDTDKTNKKFKRFSRVMVPMGGVSCIGIKVPRKAKKRLTIYDPREVAKPIWHIYQDVYRENADDTAGKIGLFIMKNGEQGERILSATAIPQIVALKISRSKIEVDLPGKITEQSEGILRQLSVSLPSLPSFSMPSFSAPNPSSLLGLSVREEKEEEKV